MPMRMLPQKRNILTMQEKGRLQSNPEQQKWVWDPETVKKLTFERNKGSGFHRNRSRGRGEATRCREVFGSGGKKMWGFLSM